MTENVGPGSRKNSELDAIRCPGLFSGSRRFGIVLGITLVVGLAASILHLTIETCKHNATVSVKMGASPIA
jgi:hypothetical protein